MEQISCLLRVAVCLVWLLGSGLTVSQAATTFIYSLPRPGTTSAGIYSNGTLVRTLWFNAPKNAGEHTGTWDNLDDEGRVVAPGNYEIRVLIHHMDYHWDGLVGNSSANMSGTTVHKGMYPIRDIAITGTKAYYTTGYNEGQYDFHRYDTRDPQVRLNSWTWVKDTRGGFIVKQFDCYGPAWNLATTDGTNVYFGSIAGWESPTSSRDSPGYVVVTRVSDDKLSEAFTHGTDLPFIGTPFVFPNGIRVGKLPGLRGLAVQTAGNLLAAAVEPENRIYLLDKLSGDMLSSFAVPCPRRIVIDARNRLWIAAGNTVFCYSLANSPASPPALLTTLTGFTNALAVGISPTRDLVVVADGGARMQLKAFTTNGAPIWTHGRAGGYQRHGPAVTDDKLWFVAESMHSLGQNEDTFITFAPDGTFWVGDGMNARTLHFSAGRRPRVIGRISMQPMSYCIAVDRNNPRRVFRNFLEFKVDYSKPLGPHNGSWTLVNNWAANSPAYYVARPDDSYACPQQVITLSNGRTYANLYRHETDTNGVSLFNGYELVELTAKGIRSTGQPSIGTLGSDGTRYRAAPNASNGSFETGDVTGWATWASGSPTNWSAKAQQSPDRATDGNYYLHLQTSGSAGGGMVAVSLGAGCPSIFSLGHTFTLSFDLQNKTNGFDSVLIELLSAGSKGGITASVQPSPAPVLHADGKWHSYTTTLTLPASAIEYHLQLRVSFLKSGASTTSTYEVNLDNFKLVQGANHVLIDRGNQYWYRAPLTGFDASGNPQWGPETALGSIEELPGSPHPLIAGTDFGSPGLMVCYEPGKRNIRHLGGVRWGETNWAWRAFPSTNTEVQTTKTYPIGYYDLGNGVATGGNTVLVSGRHIIVGYHGEAWHGNQANQLMHFYDDGLLIGEFGVSGIDTNGQRWPPDYSKAGYAGNASSPVLANVRGELYVYLNDEWGTPLQRYHLIGANDIRELSGTGALNSTIKLRVYESNQTDKSFGNPLRTADGKRQR